MGQPRWRRPPGGHPLLRQAPGGASLAGADLQGAKLNSANLPRADLGGANVEEANLHRADLQGTVLTNARNLTRKQLNKACGSDKTKLPDDLADYQMKPCPKPAQSPSN